MIVRHRNPRTVKGIGFNNVGASFQVSFMNTLNDLWLCQNEQVVIAFQIISPISKTLATVIGFFQFMALDHGTHRTIDN